VFRDIEDAVAALNNEFGQRYLLVGRLEGGFQQGAYELLRPDGGRAVLKLWHAPRPLAHAQAAAGLVELARSAGWRTPAWLHTGTTSAGHPYEVQEFVLGEHRARLDGDTLDRLLELNAKQADLHPATTQDWSAYAWDVVFNDRDSMLSELEGSSTEGRHLADAMRTGCAPALGLVPPTSDLVSGVFSLENILFDEAGDPVVIDAEAIGKGTRAFDLAVLYSRPQAYAHDPRLERRLRGAADAVAGPEVFNVCLAAEIIGVAYFGLRHWPDDVPAFCARRQLLFA
jgi:Ser/Thr protein kinase RdoA (MazF antagonist)